MSRGEPTSPLLAIDTSTHFAGLTLYTADGVLAECQWRAGQAQTAALLPQVDQLLTLGGVAVNDLGAVAVATGPGSFTGLRVGLSAAKGLVYGLGLPLFGVPTLDATAYPHLGQGRPVRAVLAAGRGRLVSALYRWRDGALQRAGEYATSSLEGLATLIVEPTLVCGELDALAARRLVELAPAARLAPPAARPRRAASLAELAWLRWTRGEHDDPAGLEPIYLHGRAPERATPALSARTG